MQTQFKRSGRSRLHVAHKYFTPLPGPSKSGIFEQKFGTPGHGLYFRYCPGKSGTVGRSAVDHVEATQSTLKMYHSDEIWNKVYTCVQSIADLHGIEAAFRDKRNCQSILKSIVLEFIGRKLLPSTSNEYKWKLYYPGMDDF